MKKIPLNWAVGIVLVISCLAIMMHSLILFDVLPYSFVWGGRLETREQAVTFELVSIAVQLLIVVIVLVRAGVFLRAGFIRGLVLSLGYYQFLCYLIQLETWHLNLHLNSL